MMNAKSKHPSNAAVIATAVSLFAFSTSALSAQSWKQFQKVGNWTVNQYDQSEAAGSKPSCSATMFAGPVQALRIERVTEGYLIGFNGLSRSQAGDIIPLTVWFDGDQSQSADTEAGFVRDAAYPLDDWASLAHRVNEKPSLMQVLQSKRSVHFGIPNLSNPQKPSTLTFQLQGAAEALKVLDNCYQTSMSGGAAQTSTPSKGSGCPDGSAKLARSGLCPSQAAALLPNKKNFGTKVMDGCIWTVNETAIPGGDFLFYFASKCGASVSELGISQNGQYAALNLVKAATSPNSSDVWKVADIFPLNGGDPQSAIRHYASLFMQDKSELGKCQVRGFEASWGYPQGAMTLDYTPAEKAKLPADEPYGACGELGFASENSAYWMVFGDHIVHLQLGQDAWIDFDPLSLTLVKANQLPRN